MTVNKARSSRVFRKDEMSIDKSVRKKSARLTVDEFAFIVSMGIALNTQVAGYDIPNVVVYGISFFWIVIALSRAVSSNGPLNRGLKPLGIRFALPKMLILLYSYFLFVTGLSSSGHPGGVQSVHCCCTPNRVCLSIWQKDRRSYLLFMPRLVSLCCSVYMHDCGYWLSTRTHSSYV